MQYIALLIAAVLVGIDRLTKWLVVSNMGLKDSIQIIKIGDREVLNISYYLNDGAAFSKFSGQTLMLVVVTSVVLAVLVVLLLTKKVKRTSYIMSFALIIGGGVGNLIDRIFNDGLVVDFIDFRIINFAIFNFADICAVCGAGLLLVTVVLDEIREYRGRKKTAGGTEEAAELPEADIKEADGAQEDEAASESGDTSDSDMTADPAETEHGDD